MIKRIQEIPINPSSYPFTSAARYLDFKAYGYEEKEYYLEGTANVYESVGNTGEVQVKYRDTAYINRIIVRTPKDPSRISKGFLCKEDGEALVRMAVSLAEKRGLV